MSFLTKALKKRIQEIHASIEAQTTELAAYEQVLAIESGNPAASASASAAVVRRIPTPSSVPKKAPAKAVKS